MLKIQKYLPIIVVAIMAVSALVGFTQQVLADETPITTGAQLGIEYGAGTGLGSQDIRATVASVIRVAMGLLGIVAVVIILIGGFRWMTAGGNDEQVGEAKQWIFAGIIGLAIILSAYALATFVINSLVGATSGAGTAPTT